MDPKPEPKLPRGTHKLRCPACQSANVHLVPPEGEFVVIVCLNCYKRWALSVAPDTTEGPEVA